MPSDSEPGSEARRQAVGAQLKELRTSKGWTQKYLAKRLKVDPITINRWEHGKVSISEPNRHELARVFGVPASAFADTAPVERPELPGDLTDRMARQIAISNIWIAHIQNSAGRLHTATKALEAIVQHFNEITGGLVDEIRLFRESMRKLTPEVGTPETHELERMFDAVEEMEAERMREFVRQAEAAEGAGKRRRASGS